MLAVLFQRSVCKRRLTAFKSNHISISISVTHVAERSCSRICRAVLGCGIPWEVADRWLCSSEQMKDNGDCYNLFRSGKIHGYNVKQRVLCCSHVWIICNKYQKRLESRRADPYKGVWSRTPSGIRLQILAKSSKILNQQHVLGFLAVVSAISVSFVIARTLVGLKVPRYRKRG